jgi:hypothetical protein
VFLYGVSEGNQRILFYNQVEGKVYVARNGVFLEKEFLSKGVSGSKVQLEEIWDVPKTVSAPLNLHGMNKELWNPLLKN